MKQSDFFGAKTRFETGSGTAILYSLEKLEKDGLGGISSFPYCLKVLLESVLRNCDDNLIRQKEFHVNGAFLIDMNSEYFQLPNHVQGLKAFLICVGYRVGIEEPTAICVKTNARL